MTKFLITGVQRISDLRINLSDCRPDGRDNEREATIMTPLKVETTAIVGQQTITIVTAGTKQAPNMSIIIGILDWFVHRNDVL